MMKTPQMKNNPLDNIIFIIKSIDNISVESVYTFGKIVLSEKVIDSITQIEKNKDIIEISQDDNIIEHSELSSHTNKLVNIEIKTGDINNYFETIDDFISGNKFECKLQDFYIKEIDYRETQNNNELMNQYKKNLIIIDFLKSISKNLKKTGNQLDLFFFKGGKGVDLKIEYKLQNLSSYKFEITNDFKSQILDSFNGEDKKELFINELVNLLENNNNSYIKLIENWDSLIINYQKSYSLFIAGFSFEKIKTSSNEHFQKLVDRIYESIGKVSNYIFGIPIGYILLINNFDFSGNFCVKNIALLILGFIFFVLIWFVLFKNIDESIKSIENDINDFLLKIQSSNELQEIYTKLESIKKSELKKQRFKLNLVKLLTISVFVIIVFVFFKIFFDICLFV